MCPAYLNEIFWVSSKVIEDKKQQHEMKIPLLKSKKKTKVSLSLIIQFGMKLNH